MDTIASCDGVRKVCWPDGYGLKKEIEFDTKLRALLGEYSYSLKDVINLFDPQSGRRAPAVECKAGSRKHAM